MTPRSLDELLADAEVLQHEYDDEDTAASRLRIEREVADTWWRSALLLESSAQQVKPWLPEDAPATAPPCARPSTNRPHRICASCPPW